MKRILVYIGIGVFVALLGLLIWLATPAGKSTVKQSILQQLESQLQYNITVGDFNTNYFSFVQMKDIQVSDSTGVNNASITHLQVNYRLFPAFRGNVFIDSLVSDGISLHFNRNLIDNISPGDSTGKGSPRWSVNVRYISVTNGSLHYEDSKTGIAAMLSGISVRYQPEDTLVSRIKSLTGKYGEIEFPEFRTFLTAHHSGSEWDIRAMQIAGTGSNVDATGWVTLQETGITGEISYSAHLGKNLMSRALTTFLPEYAQYAATDDVTATGNLRYSGDRFTYSGTVNTNAIGFDTLNLQYPIMKYSGDASHIRVHRFRTYVDTPADTLSAGGVVDWQQKYGEVQLNAHLSSLGTLKHLLHADSVDVESSVNLSLDVKIPYADLETSTGLGRLTLTKPQVLGKEYSAITAAVDLNKGNASATVKYLENRLSGSGRLTWPFEFDGNIAITDFTEIDSTLATTLSPRITAEFSGTAGEENSPVNLLGTLHTRLNGKVDGDINLYPVNSEIAFQGNAEQVRITKGTLSLGSLEPLTVSGETHLDSLMSARLIISEPQRSTEASAGKFVAGVSEISPGTFRGKLDIDQLSLEYWSQLLPRTEGQVRGDLTANSAFSLDEIGLAGGGSLHLQNTRFGVTPVDSVLLDFHWNSKGIWLDSGSGYSRNLTASIDGFLPFTTQDSVRVEMKAENWPLDITNPFLPQSWQIRGQINPHISLSGTYLSPSVQGVVEVDSGYFSRTQDFPPVQDLQGRMTFSGTTYRVKFLRFRYADYPVAIDGTGTLSPSFSGQLSVKPIGDMQIYYDHMQQDTVHLGLTDLPVDLVREYIPLKFDRYGYLSGRLDANHLASNLTLQTSGFWRADKDSAAADWQYRWNADYKDRRVHLRQSELNTDSGSIGLSGYVPLDPIGGGITQSLANDSLRLHLTVNQLDLTSINHFTDMVRVNSGSLHTNLDIRGTWWTPQVSGILNGSDINLQSPVGSWKIAQGRAGLTFSNRSVAIDSLEAVINDYPLALTGDFAYGKNYSLDTQLEGTFNHNRGFTLDLFNDVAADTLYGTFHIPGIDLQDVVSVLHLNQNIKGNADLTFRITGSRNSPRGRFQSSVDGLELAGVSLKQTRIAGRYDAGWITLDTLVFAQSKTYIRGAGRISAGLDLNQFALHQLGERMHFTFQAHQFPLEAFNVLATPSQNISGNLNADFQYDKDQAATAVNGGVRISDFSSAIPYFEETLQHGQSELQFTGSAMRIKSGSVQVGSRPVQFGGSVHLAPNEPLQYDVSIHTDKIALNRPKETSIVLSPSDIRILTRSGSPTLIEGTLRVNSFRYTRDIPNPQLISLIGTKTIRPRQFTRAMMQDIRLNLAIQMLQNASVNNNMAKLNFTADVQMNGPLFNPRYSGRVLAKDGKIFYLGRTFTIQESQVLFTGTPELNPNINILAKTTVPAYQNVDEIDYNITMHITNTLRQPRVQLSADPPVRPKTGELLTQSDIIGLLAVGRPREQFSGFTGEGNISEALLLQAKRFSSEKIASAVEYRVGRLLDLDKVAIEGNLFNMSGAHPPTFTAQKDLSSRLTLTYSTAIGQSNEQGVRLNYQLSPNWFLVTETNQQEEYGVDVKYRIRFK